jgi:hypothetical protein
MQTLARGHLWKKARNPHQCLFVTVVTVVTVAYHYWRINPMSSCERIPILDAYSDGNVWLVWCMFCHRWHSHSPGQGFRHAHCHHPDSPYVNGYKLRYAGRFSRALLRFSRQFMKVHDAPTSLPHARASCAAKPPGAWTPSQPLPWTRSRDEQRGEGRPVRAVAPPLRFRPLAGHRSR